MKSFRIEPIGRDLDVATASTVVNALLANGNGRVRQVCGGKGLCATCHVKVRSGGEALSPLNARERSTLSMLTGADGSSRLACQAKVMAEGAVVEVPSGIYLESLADADSLVGRRAEEDLRHPVTGQILVPMGKLITRSIVNQLKQVQLDVLSILESSEVAR
jgi:ferredoxin